MGLSSSNLLCSGLHRLEWSSGKDIKQNCQGRMYLGFQSRTEAPRLWFNFGSSGHLGVRPVMFQSASSRLWGQGRHPRGSCGILLLLESLWSTYSDSSGVILKVIHVYSGRDVRRV